MKTIEKIFNDIGTINSFIKINNSFSQQVYLCEINKIKYILKLYNDRLKWENEYKYLTYFNGFLNVPEVCKKGQIKNNFYIITKYIEGKSYIDEEEILISDNLFTEIGAQLGKMHSLETIDEDNWKKYMIYRLERAEKSLKEKNINFSDCINYLKESIIKLDYRPVSMHSDFRIGNLIFNNQVYLIDFESVKPGDAVFDFVKMYRLLSYNQFSKVLDGYVKHFALPNNFEQRLHLYNLYDAITTMGWCIEANRYNCDFYKFNEKFLYEELDYLCKKGVIPQESDLGHFSSKK